MIYVYLKFSSNYIVIVFPKVTFILAYFYFLSKFSSYV